MSKTELRLLRLGSDSNDRPVLCQVCDDCDAFQMYGIFACFDCVKFFENSIKTYYDPYCSNGNCSGWVELIQCHYCLLNKCLLKMKIEDVRIKRNFLRRKDRQQNPGFSGERTDWENRWSMMLNCLSGFKQSFYEWIALFPEYQKLNDVDKENLKKRCLIRAIIMEIVERSYGIHEVLRFDHFFWDPTKDEMNDKTFFMSRILSLTLLMEEHCQSKQKFNAFKLKLDLDNHVNIWFDEEDQEKVDDLMKMLKNLEFHFKRNIGNIESHTTDANSARAINSPLAPDYSFPSHQIQMTSSLTVKYRR